MRLVRLLLVAALLCVAARRRRAGRNASRPGVPYQHVHDGHPARCPPSPPTIGSDRRGRLGEPPRRLGLRRSSASATPARGVPLGPEFRVNTYTTGQPVRSRRRFGLSRKLPRGLGQRAPGRLGRSASSASATPSSGRAAGSEFRVNTLRRRSVRPSVATDTSGNFVVVWQSDGQDGSGPGVFGQRYAAFRALRSVPSSVSTPTTTRPAVSLRGRRPSGVFVVVWDSDGPGRLGLRRVRPAVRRLRRARWVLSSASTRFTTGAQVVSRRRRRRLRATSSSSGRATDQDGSGHGVFGQRYASVGQPARPGVRVSTASLPAIQSVPVRRHRTPPAISSWSGTATSQDGSSDGIFGQRFASSARPTGPSSASTPTRRRTSSVRPWPRTLPGNFVVVWASFTQDGSGPGVFGQRYGPIVPVELMGFEIE